MSVFVNLVADWLKRFAIRGKNALLYGYDIVDITNPNGDRYVGKVKAWGCTGQRYSVCSVVPHLRNRSTYSVPTTEGAWVNVAQGKIASWSWKPVMDTIADVHGRVRIAPVREIQELVAIEHAVGMFQKYFQQTEFRT